VLMNQVGVPREQTVIQMRCIVVWVLSHLALLSCMIELEFRESRLHFRLEGNVMRIPFDLHGRK
jgi:hypothetical protein